jgi:2-dehydro-3-deoxygluconokinase
MECPVECFLECRHIRPPKVKAVDSIGSGDVLSGAFLARLLAGSRPLAAGQYAVMAAALSTRGYGLVVPIPSALEVR